MSKESFNLLKGTGYNITCKMGKTKFIPVFPPLSKSSKARRKRLKLVSDIILECLADPKITDRIKRSEDLVTLSMKIQDLMNYPEYAKIDDQYELRYKIAQLLVDPEHRETVENILNQNLKRNRHEYRPICKVPKCQPPDDVLKTIFDNYSDVWDFSKNRYKINAVACRFHGAMKDLMSKDWLQNYCILAGYVPVMKNRKLSEIGRKLQSSCECRKFDKYWYKKSLLKKLQREVNNYRYHTMKKSLNRIDHRSVLLLHNRPSADNYLVGRKTIRPGVWTRVFKGTFAQSKKSEYAVANRRNEVESEKEFFEDSLKDISTPQFSVSIKSYVAIKVFAISPKLPWKLIPTRVMNMLELGSVLDHPNIVRFVETFASNRDIFMIMNYAENNSLHHIINTHGRLFIKTAQAWTFQIAMALQYLHAAGIIHRNVKCSNVLIDGHYNALLSGFGSAKVRWLDLLNLDVTESVNFHIGYPPYKAPEILRKKPYFMPPIDVWSLGVVLFRMINNCYPFCYHYEKPMLEQQKLKKWNGSWRRSSIPQNCLNLLKGILEPNPTKRLRINEVVSHSWFKMWTIPKAHEEALQKAPFLFVPEEKASIDKDVLNQSVIHKNYEDTLNDIADTLGAIVSQKRKTPRSFKRLEDIPGYQTCYKKNIRGNNLLGKIDNSLRKPQRKMKQVESDEEQYEYLSENEVLDIQKQTEGNINELKLRPEEAQEMLRSAQGHKEKDKQKSLSDVVAKVKEKTLKTKARQEELTKKLAIFMPKVVESEPRSILQIKSWSRSDKKVGELKSMIPSKASTSTADFRQNRSVLGFKPSNEFFPHRDFSSLMSLSNLKVSKSNIPFPKLEFAHKADDTTSDLTIVDVSNVKTKSS